MLQSQNWFSNTCDISARLLAALLRRPLWNCERFLQNVSADAIEHFHRQAQRWPLWGSSLCHVRHLTGVFFSRAKDQSLFGGSDALGRISVISEGEPRRLPDLGSNRRSFCAHRGDCADAAGPARNARAAAVGTEIVFQGAMVSIIMFTPANALSISPRTRSTSPFRNA